MCTNYHNGYTLFLKRTFCFLIMTIFALLLTHVTIVLDTRATQTNWGTSLKPSFLFFFQKKDFSFRALLPSDTQNIKGAQSIAWYVWRVYILIWVVAHIFQTTLSVPNCEYQNSDVIPIFASTHWSLYYKRVYWYSDHINGKSISIT